MWVPSVFPYQKLVKLCYIVSLGQFTQPDGSLLRYLLYKLITIHHGNYTVIPTLWNRVWHWCKTLVNWMILEPRNCVYFTWSMYFGFCGELVNRPVTLYTNPSRLDYWFTPEFSMAPIEFLACVMSQRRITRNHYCKELSQS